MNPISAKRIGFLIGLCLSLVACSPEPPAKTATTDDLRTAQLASTCLTCHPAVKDPKNAIVSLNGRNPAELESLLGDFRSGKRSGTVMNQIAKGLSVGQIERLSAHFAKQP